MSFQKTQTKDDRPDVILQDGVELEDAVFRGLSSATNHSTLGCRHIKRLDTVMGFSEDELRDKSWKCSSCW